MNQLTLPPSLGSLPTVFANQAGAKNDDLSAGVTGGFAVVGYKGKVWSIKYQGENYPLLREDGDGPRGSIEVVLLKASAAISKIYYEKGFTDGDTSPPDCWSVDGVRPDPASSKPQCATCAGCKWNAFGSRVTENGKAAKACSDSRRLAVVPLADLENEAFGGPMLLRTPAASLKDLRQFGENLNRMGYPYYSIAMRIGFDHEEAFPKFTFGAIRVLDEGEARRVVELQNSPQVARILNQAVENVTHEPAAAPPPPVMFEQPPPAAAQPVATPTVTPAPAPAPAPAPVPAHDPTTGEIDEEAELQARIAAIRAAKAAKPAPAVNTTATAAPGKFDAMLDELLPKAK